MDNKRSFQWLGEKTAKCNPSCDDTQTTVSVLNNKQQSEGRSVCSLSPHPNPPAPSFRPRREDGSGMSDVSIRSGAQSGLSPAFNSPFLWLLSFSCLESQGCHLNPLSYGSSPSPLWNLRAVILIPFPVAPLPLLSGISGLSFEFPFLWLLSLSCLESRGSHLNPLSYGSSPSPVWNLRAVI